MKCRKNFSNIWVNFKAHIRLIDVGSHMPSNDQLRSSIDQLTDNGKKIEAVIAVHPFHTLISISDILSEVEIRISVGHFI